MEAPEKAQTPTKIGPMTPQKKSSPMPFIRSPGFKAPSPDEVIPYTYASGVLPISYTWDEACKMRIWQVLFCIEFRRNENRLCLHPLAGKKEIIDENIPIKTAVREFTEESYGVYKDFELEKELNLNVCTSATWTFIKQSAMYFIFTYIPYKEDIQERYLQAKGENTQGSALVWIPFTRLIQLRSKITARFEGKDIEPSDCFRMWLNYDEMIAGYHKICDLTSTRLKLNNSPIGHVDIPQENKDIDGLSEILGDVKIKLEEEPKSKKEDETLSKPQSDLKDAV